MQTNTEQYKLWFKFFGTPSFCHLSNHERKSEPILLQVAPIQPSNKIQKDCKPIYCWKNEDIAKEKSKTDICWQHPKVPRREDIANRYFEEKLRTLQTDILLAAPRCEVQYIGPIWSNMVQYIVAKEESETYILLAAPRCELAQLQVGLFSRLSRTCPGFFIDMQSWSVWGNISVWGKTIEEVYSGEPSKWHPECSTEDRVSCFTPA